MDKQLTSKQEHFAQCVADGMTQADAYRTAYDVSADTLPETIWSRASELMADGKVSGRVKELKGKLSEKAIWTREMSVKALAEAYRMARNEKTPAAMTGAVKELNVMHGYNEPVKLDLTNSDGSLRPKVIEIVAKTVEEK